MVIAIKSKQFISNFIEFIKVFEFIVLPQKPFDSGQIYPEVYDTWLID